LDILRALHTDPHTTIPALALDGQGVVWYPGQFGRLDLPIISMGRGSQYVGDSTEFRRRGVNLSSTSLASG
jgi:hypothetical protein